VINHRPDRASEGPQKMRGPGVNRGLRTGGLAPGAAPTADRMRRDLLDDLAMEGEIETFSLDIILDP
jgi:hypothetical protein